MLWWRFLIAGALVFPFALRDFSKKNHSFKEFFNLFFFGGIVSGLCSLLYFQAAQDLGTGMAMIIFFTFPIFVVLFSWIFDKYSIQPVIYLSILLIIIGLVLLVNDGCHHISFKGGSAAIASGFFYAVYIFISKRSKTSPLYLTWAICWGSAFNLLVLGMIDQGNFWFPHLSPPLKYTFFTAFFATLLPTVLLLEAMKRISATKASLLSVFEPISTTLIGVVLLGECVSFTQFIGAIVVLTGACLTYYEK